MIRNETVIGVMVVQSFQGTRSYKRRDLDHLLTIAPQVATAIEHKRALEELKTAEEKFSKAFFASPAWMLITLKESGEILEVNEAFLTATGYQQHEIIGRECILSAALDLSEIRQLEDRLRQAQKMESIGNLAGGIAHDFNNILFPILGMAEMMMEEFPRTCP